MNNTETAEEKVECCMHCKRLYLVEEGNDIICRSCYSINKVEILPNIETWLEKYGHIWNTE